MKLMWSKSSERNMTISFLWVVFFFSQEKEIIARFDRTQLIRVITNLIKNSIQAINQRNPENPRIEVHVYSEEANAIITVEDNGLGISKSYKDMVSQINYTSRICWT